MSKQLNTLVTDIYGLLDTGVVFTPNPDNLESMTKALATHMTSAMGSRGSSRELGKMWFSDLGEKCARKTWYKWHQPELGEVLGGHTLFKFLYGNIIEEQVLFLAKEAGHSVSREQDRIETSHNGWVLSGRIDAVIDGVLIDVKSTSSYGFKKYRLEGVTEENDSFGYRYQLSGYHQLATAHSSRDKDPAFIFVDKQNGHIEVVPIDPISKQGILERIDQVAEACEATSDVSLARGYEPVPVGQSGNMGLGVACSYCPYKKACWPGLKAYAYSTGPVFLTLVKRTPNTPEITL